ncbi:M56 family metallopeptidase [Flavivirga spongiicola]|uniref:M56 family metallopeptidase n=1 Tax=Flavivirga spongiicola TaxID=421621 RepID=A0ABU7XV43_9FLAO|nr:M56 family metallopeptidase [Flavivirga sp. MEBiC05379]MDO5979656.1 M56 family metallopeptidase [Flavivirga sp. MEBiC05379]
MIHYIIQTIAFQLFFLLVYDVFLKRETFFNWNRMYLLSTGVLSLILPFIKVDSFKKVVPQDYIVSLPEIVLGQSPVNSNNTILLDVVVLNTNALSIWEVIFYIGVLVAFSLFLFKVIKIFSLVIKNPKQSIGKVVLVELLNSNAAFSFFHYIFLGEHIKIEDKETILKHELIHTEQKHTIDLLFFEVLRILFWFNPLVYMYQNRIATLHEFIADANALKHQNKEAYYQNLLAQVFETKNISFINTFFNQSLIKKRIVMLSKSKSKQIHLFKYALLIPMVFGMLVYTSSEGQEIQKESINLSQYTYTLNVGEKEMSIENKKIHNNYEAFLKSHPDYVSWAHFDEEKKTATYSVHSLNEKVPEYYEPEPWVVNSSEGQAYKMYVYFKNIPESAESKKRQKEELLKLKEKYTNASEVPFSVIENVPVFPECEREKSNAKKRDCTSKKIAQFVNRNFNTELASALNLTGRQRINVIFKIDKTGSITGVRARAPHPDLEAEAIRVIKALPKMIPGTHKGKSVIVPYSLPIIFQVADATEMLDEVEVPFAVIENVPVFPGCEDLLSNADKKKCMNENITNFIIENFNTKVADQNGLSGRQRINVIFKIDAEGNISTDEIRARAPHIDLEAEAIRVISAIPKMKPGVQRGKNVTVSYSLPIIFDVENDTQMLDEVAISGYEKDKLDISVPYSVVDKAPIFPGCESLQDKQEQKKCTSNAITKHVNRNFNTELATELGLSGRQRINVIFKINKEGNITGVRSRAPHPALEVEAIRVINTLPKMIPGEQRGKKVDVPYSLPIIFQVAEEKK